MTARLVLIAAACMGLCAAQSFDAASIRPSQFQSGDGESGGQERIQVRPNGLAMQAVTLHSCIAWAYDVQDFQVSGATPVDRFDISATTSSSVSVTTLRTMLASLLAERFKLALHRESRELSALALVVAKGGPKAALHASPQNAPGILQPSRGVMAAQHATMAEFIVTLSGPLRTPVIDKTRLTGRYDFTIDINPYLTADQPDVRDAIASALRDQLGLNLESRKERVEILVIDHAEKTPVEN